MATRKPAAPAPEEPENEPQAEAAAEQASEQAQQDAQAQANARGIELTDDQLKRIGAHAAQETFKLFDGAGAFQKPEPPPPPAPPEPQEPEHVDEAPRKTTWAAKVIGGI